MDEHLPVALRNSRLPWTPDLEQQAPAPAPNDSWAALVGTLEWSIITHLDHEEPPSFLLGLRDIANEEDFQHVFQAYPSILLAVTAAEAHHDLLLEQLRRAITSPA